MQIRQEPNASKKSEISITTLSQTIPQIARFVIERYGEPRNFLTQMSPDAQALAAANPNKVYRSEISVTKIKLAYGFKVVEVWLMAQLENLNRYAGVKNKMEFEQMEELARIIAIDYGYLRGAEILLFFHRLKKGAYGPLYGSVDPLLLANALCQYDNERQVVIARIQAEDEQKRLNEQREHSAKYAITREECERRKKLSRRKRFVELSHKKKISILKK